MNIMEGIKIKGQKVKIPDTSRDEFPQFLVDMGYKVGAEIGVYKGEYTEKFCKVGLKMYAVDPWLIYEDYTNPKGQKRLDFQYEHTKRFLAPYDCTIVRKTSMDAVKDFANESLDFVYIDGNHTFRYVAEDIFEWEKKVKKGGIVAGHDYIVASSAWSPCHVKYVVDAYIASFHIQNLYLLDASNSNELVMGKDGKYKDRTRTWFWIKQ